ncbi:MAG: hypothetical protein ACYCS7_10530 [Acidimicrobiales bacterium]
MAHVETAAPAGSPRTVRPASEVLIRRLLLIPEGPASATEDDAHRIFSTSIALSAFRCLLGYVVLPILTPAIGAAAGAAPVIGIPIALLALFFDFRGIRRFWLADHRWRWGISLIYLMVMGLVGSLLVMDLIRISR